MRLIDADALLRPISSYNPVKYTHEYGDVVTVQDVKSIPTIDAVTVVRCKDCEYYTEEERWCRRLGLCGAFDQNGYCSHAERRIDG